MTLPAPNLDDRGFQDLVDEAKRLVQLRNPNWTDHNVSDPGVTLIETFAYMADQLIYRLNRVPDLHYVKFLELLGEKMIPPGAAATDLRFRLTIAQDTDVIIPEATLVSTPRTTPAPPVTFSTAEDLAIPAVSVSHVLVKPVNEDFQTHNEARALRKRFPAFSNVPVPGDALYIGITQPAKSCIVDFEFSGITAIEGIGVDPTNPPYTIEAWNGRDWSRVEVAFDETGGLNRDGIIEVFIEAHELSRIAGIEAAWVRIVVEEFDASQPRYKVTPEVSQITAETMGGMVKAHHCEPVMDEILGPCSGAPGEQLQLSRHPLAGTLHNYMTADVSESHGWETWTRVAYFSESGPNDRHFTLDEGSGEMRFGPVIRQPDGSVRLYGATPPAQAMVRIPKYFVGGGREGNVEPDTLTVLRSSLPFVGEVTNPRAATGGSDAESIEDLKQRAAISVRTQTRAVAARDYELIVKQAEPSFARVACLDATELGKPGHVIVLVVPWVPRDIPDFQLLQPSENSLRAVRDVIDFRRPLGTVVHIEPPRYLGVSVAVRLVAAAGADPRVLTARADDAIRDFLHPVTGGPQGEGWPFGYPLLLADVHSVLQRIPGLSYVDVVRLIPVDVVSGLRGAPAEIVQPGVHDLLFCVGNEIEVRT
ncbi:MAG: putative baseplate assembly protein [Actinobacteria bacterium]|nr:putative baseplate assembly protein [Actinomycetota bacterium]